MAKTPKNSKKKKISSKVAGQLQDYLDLMEKENLLELEITDGPLQVKLVRQGKAQPMATSAPPSKPASSKLNGKDPSEEKNSIKSPLAGVFYRSPSPTAKVFVQEGDVVTPGKVLCIIEAMKVMNEVSSDKRGRIRRILVENGQPVESGQPLFLLESVN